MLGYVAPAGTLFAFRSVTVGSAAPALAVKTADGKEAKLAFGQRLTVLAFWRSNQPFSREALSDLEQIRKEFSPQDLDIIAIAESGASAEALRSAKVSYPIYLDGERKAEEEYGVIVFPSTGIIAKDGRLKFFVPSRNSNYREIIRGRIRVELGALAERDFDARMKAIGESLGTEASSAEEHFKTGLRLTRLGKRAEAVQELKQSVALNPDSTDAHLALGYAYLETEENKAAEQEFHWVLKRHPESPGAKVGIGICKVRAGDLDGGISLLKTAVALNPDPVQGYFELGAAYEKKGDLQHAAESYQWAVKKLLQGRR